LAVLQTCFPNRFRVVQRHAQEFFGTDLKVRELPKDVFIADIDSAAKGTPTIASVSLLMAWSRIDSTASDAALRHARQLGMESKLSQQELRAWIVALSRVASDVQ
jgi:hypothetical protein